MSESGTSNHPLMPDLLIHRDSFLHYLTKIHFHVGEDPGLVPRIMRWIGICQRDAHECRALGYQILMDKRDFLIGNAPATFASIDTLYDKRKRQLSEAERLATLTQWPACRIVPDRTLSVHEISLKYYTVEKHVGKSVDQLKERLNKEPDTPRASSFFDRATAESAVARVLTLFSSYIAERFRKGDKQLDLPPLNRGFDVGFQLGPVVQRDGTVVISSRVKICLRRDSNDQLSFRIKSAYPTL